MKTNRAIVFFAWGADYVARVATCIRESRLPQVPVCLITNSQTDVAKLPGDVEVLGYDCQLAGKAKKTEFFTRIPQRIETALILDADTRVIDDVSLGFEKAERHGIAVVPAPTALGRLCPPAYIAAHTFLLRTKERLDLEKLKTQLVTAGYEHVTPVVAPGSQSPQPPMATCSAWWSFQLP